MRASPFLANRLITRTVSRLDFPVRLATIATVDSGGQLEGPQLKVKLQNISGQLAGPATVYLHSAIAMVESPAGDLLLASRSWIENSDPLGRVKRHHVIWHTLELNEVSGQLVAKGGGASAVDMYAASVSTNNGSIISVDGASIKTGLLPTAHVVQGEAIWIRGDFTFSAFPQEDLHTAVAIRGSANAISIGGVPALDLAPVVASSIVVGLGTALAVLRSVLVSRVLLPLYSLVRRDDARDHPIRGLVRELIKQNPGIAYTELRTLAASAYGAGVGHGTLQYHLNRIERQNVITSGRTERRRVYFNAEEDAARHHILLAGKAVGGLAKAIIQNPGLSHKDLSTRLGGNPATARQRCRHHLRKLILARLVHTVIDGRQRRHYPEPTLVKLLEKTHVARNQTRPIVSPRTVTVSATLAPQAVDLVH